MRLLILILLFIPLLVIPYIQAITNNKLRFAVLAGSFGYPNPTFPDFTTAAEYGTQLYQYIGAIYSAIDLFESSTNQAGGIPLHDINNTHYLVEYDIFNLDWYPYEIYGDLTHMIQLISEITNSLGSYGQYDFVFQCLVPPELVPTVSLMCQGKCIVLNILTPEDHYYICENTFPDCLTNKKRPGYRRFDNTFTAFRDYSQSANPQISLWYSYGIQNLVIISSDTIEDVGFVQQLIAISDEFYINIIDQIIIPNFPDPAIINDEYFDSLISNWINLNVDSIEIIGASATLTANWTQAIQNLIYQMRKRNYMPAGMAINTGTLNMMDFSTINYMWTAIDWDPLLRGPNYRAINSTINLELFSTTPGQDSSIVFYNKFLHEFPEYTNVGSSVFVAIAIAMESCIVVQKLIETAGSTLYQDIIQASLSISVPSFYGKLQFDQYGRFVTIDSESIVAMIQDEVTDYSYKIIFPLSRVNKIIFPMPLWSERIYNQDPRGTVAEKIIMGITGIICLIILLTMLLTFSLRNYVIIKTSTPSFLIYFLFGTLIMISSLFFYNLDPTDSDCAGTIWFFCIGFDFMFLALAIKNYRIAQIFRTDQLKVIKMTNYNITLKLFGLVGLEIIYLIIWNIVGGMNSNLMVPDPIRINNNYHLCLSGNSDYPFLIVEIVFKFLIVFGSTIIAWRIRAVNSYYNESKYISACIYVTLLIGTLFTALIGIGSFSRYTLYGVVVAGIWICCISNVFLIYNKKIDIFTGAYMKISKVTDYSDPGIESAKSKEVKFESAVGIVKNDLVNGDRFGEIVQISSPKNCVSSPKNYISSVATNGNRINESNQSREINMSAPSENSTTEES